MTVSPESLERVRQQGRNRNEDRMAGEMAAHEGGREDMLACVIDSSRLTTRAAVQECERKLSR